MLWILAGIPAATPFAEPAPRAAPFLPAWRPPATNDMANLDQAMEILRAKFKLPSLAAAMVSSGKVLAAGISGVRKQGSPERASLADKYHIGSVTKSMTALLVAERIAEGTWVPETTVGQVLDWPVGAEFQSLRLEELLSHRTGLPRQASRAAWSAAWRRVGEPAPEQRRRYVLDFAADPIAKDARGKFEYSNQNYSILGAMLEKVAAKPWETLIFEELLTPLGMASAGIGPPATDADPNQPWGHVWRDGAPVPVPHSDNPSAIGPGGKVHCNLMDLGVYASYVLTLAQAEIAGSAEGKRGEALKRMFTPAEGGEYAWGWNIYERGWAKRKAITHNGTNTMFYAVVWIAPNRDRAFVAVTNLGGDQASQGCDQAVAEMIRQFLN